MSMRSMDDRELEAFYAMIESGKLLSCEPIPAEPRVVMPGEPPQEGYRVRLSFDLTPAQTHMLLGMVL